MRTMPSQNKGKRLIQILLSLERIMDMLRLAVQDDEHLRGEIEKRERSICCLLKTR